MTTSNKLNRRDFLKGGLLGLAGLVGLGGPFKILENQQVASPVKHGDEVHDSHGGFGAVGEVDHNRNRFHPNDILYDFDYGRVSTLDNGQTLREYEFIAVDREIEVAPGVFFPAWVYASPTSPTSVRFGQVVGTVPGPTIRCIEGELIRIKFTNAGSHPHTIHFHGIHSAVMDGVPGIGDGMIAPGDSTIYEFHAAPFGCHLYHCHAIPLKRHIHKGLYGVFIVDPNPDNYSGDEREIAKTRNHTYPENKFVNEMVMVLNGFDTNFDGENEIYAANSIAFAYMNQPIPITGNQLQRIYLVNVTEFDPINSIHIHANFFDYFDHGTTLTPTLKMVDTIMQCQAQRGIVEVSFKGFQPGKFMFHAHQSELAELGWMGFFDLT